VVGIAVGHLLLLLRGEGGAFEVLSSVLVSVLMLPVMSPRHARGISARFAVLLLILTPPL
jgi:hypothetical protein